MSRLNVFLLLSLPICSAPSGITSDSAWKRTRIDNVDFFAGLRPAYYCYCVDYRDRGAYICDHVV